MGQALYRKYRSKTLSDIIGQDHITRTLEQAIKTNRVSHAYLFTGPKGVGKTSIARILAREINGLSYAEGSSPVDIIEIDAASHSGVDEIRDLREKVYITPVSAKYKVYIIDEVHMLSKQAFNALLKTLEEPPAHVIFILATTDTHKLPETIISRTQRYQFKPIETPLIAAHLRHIADNESIKIDDAALRIIAEHGQGSFRDAISLLDQAANYTQPINADTVNSLLGIPPDHLLEDIVESIYSNGPGQIVIKLNHLYEQGFSASIISSKLSDVLREYLINNRPGVERHRLLDLLSSLIDVPASADPERYLEICLLRALPEQRSDEPVAADNQSKSEPQTEQATKPAQQEIKPADEKNNTKAELETAVTKRSKVMKQPSSESTPLLSFDQQAWQAILEQLRTKYNTLYGIVRMASVDMTDPQVLKLQFAYPFHQKRLNDAKYRDIILDTVKQVTGKDVALVCVVDKDLLKLSKKEKQDPNLQAISSIFGISQ